MYHNFSFPFLYHDDEDHYKIFLWLDEKLYLPLDFLTNPEYRPFLNALLKICFSPGEKELNLKKRLKTLERRIYTYWAVDQDLSLPLRSKFYAQTCKAILHNNPQLDFHDSTVHVLAPVLRSMYTKFMTIESLKEKGYTLLSSNIHLPQSEQWIDAVFKNPEGQQEILFIQQAYFHEGKSLSESAEALWRLGAGSFTLGIAYLEELNHSLSPEKFSNEISKINELIEFLKNDPASSSAKRKSAMTLLHDLDLSGFNSAQTGLFELGKRMIQPGFLDHWFTKMSSRDIQKVIPSADSFKVIVDTRFDVIRTHLSDLENKKDPLSRYLIETSKEKKDPLFELLKERFKELALEHSGKNFKLENAAEHFPVPSNTEEIRLKVNEMLQNEDLNSGIFDILEGQLYSRYCGLLLELLGAEFLSSLDLKILNTGLELTDDNGIYFTELDGVIKNLQTGRVALVEAKSMRTGLPKKYVLANKVVYKLKTYLTKRKMIEDRLSTSFEDVIYIIDTGGNKALEKFLKDQEKELEKEYGFPIKFISLDMAKKVKSVTGYEGVKKTVKKADSVPAPEAQKKKKIPGAVKEKIPKTKAEYRNDRRLAKQELKRLLAQFQNGNLPDKAA